MESLRRSQRPRKQTNRELAPPAPVRIAPAALLHLSASIGRYIRSDLVNSSRHLVAVYLFTASERIAKTHCALTAAETNSPEIHLC